MSLGMIMREVDEDRGDDLGVLVLDQVGDRRCVHPLQAFDAVGVAGLQDARDQVGRLVVAERLGQHRADVGVGIDVHRRRFFGRAVKLAQHLFDARARHRFERRHGVPELLHLLRPEVLEHLGGVVLAEGDEQDGALSIPSSAGIGARPFLDDVGHDLGSCCASARAAASFLSSNSLAVGTCASPAASPSSSAEHIDLAADRGLASGGRLEHGLEQRPHDGEQEVGDDAAIAPYLISSLPATISGSRQSGIPRPFR
jgi:hypothetical protein